MLLHLNYCAELALAEKFTALVTSLLIKVLCLFLEVGIISSVACTRAFV